MSSIASEHEAARLAALRRYHILDTPAEDVFDEITTLAAQICETPIALISLVDDVRQWFKSRVGLIVAETPRNMSFCAHTIEHPDRLLLVENATEDRRFATNPLVTATPHVRFYAGSPVVTPDGYTLGTLCVIDHMPRGLRPEQQKALRILARQVSAQIELRYQLAEQEQRLIERVRAEAALAQRAQLAALGADIGVALTQPAALESILQRCAEALVQHLQAAFARIWTLNEAENTLELQASAGLYTHRDGAHGRVPVGQFKIGLIAAARQPHLTNTVVGDPRIGDQAWAQREGMVAFAGYPLIMANRLVGVMALFARHALPDTTLDVLASVADEVALGIERKRAEDALSQQAQALRESEAHLRAVLSSVVDGIITINEDGLIESFNSAAERIFGYSASEVIGENVKRLMPEPYHSAHDAYLKRYQEEGDARIIGIGREVSGQRRDGTTFPMELGVSEVQQGGQRLFIGSVRDISERQAVERMKDEFVSVVSHELRTPLTSIRGSLGLLAGGLLGPLPEKGQHMLDIAVQNTDRLVRLINDILDIERIESGKITLTKEACNLATLMTQAGDVMQAMADQAGVTLVVRPYEGQIVADPDRLIQTLTNLLSNAIKFSPPGATVWLEAERHSREVVFQVKDQGRGIPPDKLERIFERFQQVDASDRRDKGGTGLGLAICRSILQHHGGRIWVESTVGTGSTFFCALPVLPEEESIGTSERLAPPLVLVYDHEPAVRTMAQAQLAQLGYRALTVATGEAVLECAITQQPAAILFNLDTLALDAWKTILTLKERPETRDTPIILFSPSTSEDALLGADGTSWACTLEVTSLCRALEHAFGVQRNMARVLIVEDDVDLAKVLTALFERHGIETFHAQSGREALELSLQVHPNLLVLDLIMPDGDGFTVVNGLRHHQHLSQIPLVVYSAQELDATDRQRLQLGCTHFLTKSRIAPEECVKRITALLQRMMPQPWEDRDDVNKTPSSY